MTDDFYNTGIVNHKFILFIDNKSIETVFDDNKSKNNIALIKQLNFELAINGFTPEDIVNEDDNGLVYYKSYNVNMKLAMEKANDILKNINKFKDLEDEKGI